MLHTQLTSRQLLRGTSRITALFMTLLSLSLIMPLTSSAHLPDDIEEFEGRVIATDLQILKDLSITPLAFEPETQVALASINTAQMIAISTRAHELGRCGGYTIVGELATLKSTDVHSFFLPIIERHRKDLDLQKALRDGAYLSKMSFNSGLNVQSYVDQVEPLNIKEKVEWLSGYSTRFHKGEQNNVHVEDMKNMLEQMVRASGRQDVKVGLVEHKKTTQKSVHVRFVGSVFADEHVVLGGHLDSVYWKLGGVLASEPAPGSDDNASGSSALVETVRVLLSAPAPRRTVDFYWYAAEEVGLFGSQDIAEDHKRENKNVVGALQLDMVMYPGLGAGTITSISDFTSPWLRAVLARVNDEYVKARIEESQCRYGCSDHASWYKNGFPSVFPTESSLKHMNKLIHTPNDKINAESSFEHAAIFSKLAVGFALELANSRETENSVYEVPASQW
ncbi:MAG: hypothetical protein COT74_02565 [Bdellovibrionales bacterium CG10_big_fil_rev_8_21_14_0_10_45_34]|nr:MAG: hypothetical protein COT74_02565 [Bdellovibrionales bacterium CG10_big_fil_rev_8_21_14_0_10_45_34]